MQKKSFCQNLVEKVLLPINNELISAEHSSDFSLELLSIFLVSLPIFSLDAAVSMMYTL